MPRFDLHLQLIDPSEQTGGATFTFGHNPVLAVRGPQKLLNRWLLTFLRRKGTDPVEPDVGTFFDNLVGGNVFDPGDLETSVHEYIDDCNAQVQAVDRRSAWLDPDERLATGILSSFRLTGPTSFEMFVTLTTVSGDTVRVLIPYARG